jgi:carboxyl-terminal processing protease
MQWVDRNRESFLKQNPTFEDFNKTYASLNLMEEFSAFAKKEGVEQNQIKKEWVNSMVLDYIVKQTKDTAAQNYTSYQSYANELLTNAELLNQVIEKAKQEDEKMEEMMKKSDIYIEATLKAMIARNLYGINYYYQSIKDTDEGLQKAIQIIKDDKVYNSIISK